MISIYFLPLAKKMPPKARNILIENFKEEDVVEYMDIEDHLPPRYSNCLFRCTLQFTKFVCKRDLFNVPLIAPNTILVWLKYYL